MAHGKLMCDRDAGRWEASENLGSLRALRSSRLRAIRIEGKLENLYAK